MKLTKTFEKIKIRWKLSIIFIAIPIAIWILANSNETISQAIKNSGLGDYLVYVYILPLFLTKGFVSQMSCDGLSCILYIAIISIAIIVLFYGALGFLIGYLIEKVRKEK